MDNYSLKIILHNVKMQESAREVLNLEEAKHILLNRGFDD